MGAGAGAHSIFRGCRMADTSVALLATEVPPRKSKSNYPSGFVRRLGERLKKPLGDAFGLTNFGVNLTRLPPGSISALRHAHSRQDEFVYILEGTPTLVTNAGRVLLKPGMCAGFKAGTGDAHHLANDGASDVVYIEIGDRTSPDEVFYPEDDLTVTKTSGGVRIFTHKDGTPY
jgi:uncharacterized cupin superfamily protein